MAVMGSPLGSMSSPATNSRLGFQYQAGILSCRLGRKFNQTAFSDPPCATLAPLGRAGRPGTVVQRLYGWLGLLIAFLLGQLARHLLKWGELVLRSILFLQLLCLKSVMSSAEWSYFQVLGGIWGNWQQSILFGGPLGTPSLTNN